MINLVVNVTYAAAFVFFSLSPLHCYSLSIIHSVKECTQHFMKYLEDTLKTKYTHTHETDKNSFLYLFGGLSPIRQLFTVRCYVETNLSKVTMHETNCVCFLHFFSCLKCASIWWKEYMLPRFVLYERKWTDPKSRRDKKKN